MGRILILSDKEDVSGQLRQDMESMGHSVIVRRLDDGAETIHVRKPELILVDLTLPGGIVELWEQLRYELADRHVETILLISRDRVREVELLEGITDFVIYPCDFRELDVRVKLILRRREDVSTGDVIKVGNLAIDPVKYEVTVDGWPVVLTLKEYELLRYLVTRRGRVITREVLLDQVWGYDYYGGTRTVDVHIGRLRTKIETGKYSFIKTVRGVGYIFTAV